MRQETRVINIYKYDELSDQAKEKALQYFQPDYGWWGCIYEDAEEIGLKITEFDIDRRNYIKGEWILSPPDVAEEITKQHGETTDTYKLAQEYIKDRDSLVKKFSDGVNVFEVTYENEYEFDQECDELENEFKRALLEEYLSMLQKEEEYLTSEEYLKETIEANDYEFYEDGSIC